jgi:hypothetical protein
MLDLMKHKTTVLQQTQAAISDWDGRKQSFPADKFRAYQLLSPEDQAVVEKANTDDEDKVPDARDLHNVIAASGVPFGGRRAGSRAGADATANEIKGQICLHFRSMDSARMVAERAELEKLNQIHKAWLEDTVAQEAYKQHLKQKRMFRLGKADDPGKFPVPKKPIMDKQLESEAKLFRDSTGLWRIISLPVVLRDKMMDLAALHHHDLMQAPVPKPKKEEGKSADDLLVQHLIDINAQRQLLYSAKPRFADTGTYLCSLPCLFCSRRIDKHFVPIYTEYSMNTWKLLVSKNNIGVPDPHCYILENLSGIEYVVDSVRKRQWPVDAAVDLMQQVSVRGEYCACWHYHSS